MKKILYLIFVLLMLGACRSVPQPKSEEVIYNFVHDSIAVHDSIYVEHTNIIREKNDTVYIENTTIKWHDRWRDKEIFIHDTTKVKETIEVEVEKSLTGWQIMWMQIGKIFGVIMLLAIIGVICYYLAKKRTGLR